ncbi:MAG: hypothetical protein COV59_04380 [Candidatus Magasanikbacteria bacterium CG11_big_fil_rev_8_21_14_0_20_39_34]|uniref:PDZ domain-containing protein n=1 Tax=Candidatus Magasanikbacteria bacterium CG11_big_fil_rev_8_21_14_0_20_39_34 TaxID=1974653 RepID=A0A2H0N4S9_9BACT|nr:MAG: hypothetical protein COV59_04380 [Candidatus Magasanikbacteria bacterium CG11_big_fil_rev_8_21_14_0_20_39_34]
MSVVSAVKRANPAVVSIVITKDVPVLEQYYDNNSSFHDFFGGGLFGGFNFQIPQYRENGTEKKEVGGGSGFLVSQDGLIITNKHVVEDPNAEYTVFLGNGSEDKYEAKVLARDPVLDIAVLKIEGTEDFPFLEFDDSDHLELGQSVIAIGNALGEFRNSVSVGVVSGLSRSIVAGDGRGGSEQLDEVVQTDAAINPGNSGGPLLDLQGKVIGVNVAVANGSQNIGFALPVNLLKGVIESVQKDGKIVRPFLGVRFVPVTKELKEANKLSVDYGVLIIRGENRTELPIVPGSPADKAGLEENDIILEADGQKLDETRSLPTLLRKKNVGDTLKLKILHKGSEKELDVKLEAIPE